MFLVFHLLLDWELGMPMSCYGRSKECGIRYRYLRRIVLTQGLGFSSLGFLFYTIKKKKKKCSSKSKSVSIMEAVKNRHRLLDWSTEVLAAAPTHTVSLDLGAGAILTANPSNIEHIHKTNFQNYEKGPTVIGTFRDLLGLGIINCDGDIWQLQRNLIVHEFATKSFRALTIDVNTSGVVKRLLPLLSSHSSSINNVFDLQAVFERFTFDLSCKITFDVDPDTQMEGYEEFLSSLDLVSRLITKRYAQPRFFRKLSLLLGRGTESVMKSELAILNRFLMKVIRDKKNKTNNTAGSDLLSRFLAVRSDLPDDLLRDMMINLMAAGRDTTASSMSWFFWLMSSRHAVQEKILAEIRWVREKHGSKAGEGFSLDELRDMNYLHATVSETLRLFPPVPVDSRVTIASDILPDGTMVKKGTAVMHSPYVMGRMEDIWGKNCKEFIPERWMGENGMFQPKNVYQYPVFHVGPRMCVGKQMAYDQIKGVVASIMEKFKVEVAEEGEREQETVMIVLRMKKGLPVTVTPR